MNTNGSRRRLVAPIAAIATAAILFAACGSSTGTTAPDGSGASGSGLEGSITFLHKYSDPRYAPYFEAVVASCLILGIYTRYAAILGAIFLTVAAMACYRVSGRRWYWTFGGAEYCVFWGICCVIVAMHG